MKDYPELRRKAVVDAHLIVHRVLIVALVWMFLGWKAGVLILVASWIATKRIATNNYSEMVDEAEKRK